MRHYFKHDAAKAEAVRLYRSRKDPADDEAEVTRLLEMPFLDLVESYHQKERGFFKSLYILVGRTRLGSHIEVKFPSLRSLTSIRLLRALMTRIVLPEHTIQVPGETMRLLDDTILERKVCAQRQICPDPVETASHAYHVRTLQEARAVFVVSNRRIRKRGLQPAIGAEEKRNNRVRLMFTTAFFDWAELQLMLFGRDVQEDPEEISSEEEAAVRRVAWLLTPLWPGSTTDTMEARSDAAAEKREALGELVRATTKFDFFPDFTLYPRPAVPKAIMPRPLDPRFVPLCCAEVPG